MEENQKTQTRDHVVVNNYTAKAQTNPMGTAGFVCALVDLFLGWVPFLGWLLWFVGAGLSIAGLFKNPKGLAIAGTVISFIDVIIISFIDVIIILIIASSVASIASML
ncbi:hypothetical protein [Companilactobacillus insicii]|uniref:hypothetical protein n=1 Tax=Companilactobacillus insicii TaxID=1732567 RepID=UPI000F7A04D3|nr:hypothetical protein [Companilactobacillus insicii]